jgi:ABC-type transport system substrate-binding protein
MRKLLVGSIVLGLCILGWDASAVGEPFPAPRGELRVVDHSLQAWGWLDWNIFDHPLEVDHDGQLVPGLATGWRWLDDRTLELTLRQGVRFHNGEIFDAEIMHLNWQEHVRFAQPNILGKHMSFTPGSRLDILDAHTVRLVFPEPDGGVLHKLAHLHIANRQFYREFGWGEKSW